MGLLSQFSSKAELHRRETNKRFDDFVLSYLDHFENGKADAGDEQVASLIARSPESGVSQAVRRHADRFAVLGIELRVIFANIDPAPVFSDFVEMTGLYDGQNCMQASIRWAKNSALLDAHEQLVLGTGHSWSGDVMRRSSDTRFSLDLFDVNGGDAVSLGGMAFDGLWSASVNIPQSRFRNVSRASGGEPLVVEFEGSIREQLMDHALESSYVTRH